MCYTLLVMFFKSKLKEPFSFFFLCFPQHSSFWSFLLRPVMGLVSCKVKEESSTMNLHCTAKLREC